VEIGSVVEVEQVGLAGVYYGVAQELVGFN